MIVKIKIDVVGVQLENSKMSLDIFSSRPIRQRLLNEIYNYDRNIFMNIEADILANRFLVCYQCKSHYEKEITNVTCHWGNYTEHYATSIRTSFSPILFVNQCIILLHPVSYEPVLNASLRVQKIEKDKNLRFDPLFFQKKMRTPLLFHAQDNFLSIKESIQNLHNDWKSIRSQLIQDIATNYT